MSKLFDIFIDRLNNGNELIIDEITNCDFLEIQEDELKFNHDLKLKGKAYIAHDHLIISLKIHSQASIPCTICNHLFDYSIHLDSFYLAKPIEEIPSPIYNFGLDIREAILLEIPPFAECNQGKCPLRVDVQKFLKNKGEKTNQPTEQKSNSSYFPFEGIDEK
ncbi:MAG: YceD family protein [Rhabdochlamydiaceae bacterium]